MKNLKDKPFALIGVHIGGLDAKQLKEVTAKQHITWRSFVDAGNAEAALAALDQLGKTGRVKLCTFDISPAVVSALEKKQIEFAIDQQEWLQGYLPIVFLANYVRYGSILQNDFILTGPSLVTSENIGKVVNLLKRIFARREKCAHARVASYARLR